MRVDVDGRDVFVHTAQDGATAGPAVVLVHGAGNDHTVWRYQTRLLAGMGLRAMAVDLPGHGRSDGPAWRTVPELAGWLGRLLDAVDAPAATVVGHSMGSFVAMAAAAADPTRVTRIGLVGTAERMGVHPALQTAADACDDAAIDMVVGWSHTGASRFGGHRQAGVWTAGQTRRLLERNRGVLGADLAACGAYEPPLDALQRLRPDAIVISGERDRMTPARGAARVVEVLGARHLVVPGGSHVSLYDHPDAVNAGLVPWLRGVRDG